MNPSVNGPKEVALSQRFIWPRSVKTSVTAFHEPSGCGGLLNGGEVGADKPASRCSPQAPLAWSPPTSPWDKIESQWLGLLGIEKERRNGRGQSRAWGFEQAPPCPGPLLRAGLAGRGGAAGQAGRRSESGCLLSTGLGGGREAFRPTSESPRGPEVRASPSPRQRGFLSVPHPTYQQGLQAPNWKSVRNPTVITWGWNFAWSLRSFTSSEVQACVYCMCVQPQAPTHRSGNRVHPEGPRHVPFH